MRTKPLKEHKLLASIGKEMQEIREITKEDMQNKANEAISSLATSFSNFIDKEYISSIEPKSNMNIVWFVWINTVLFAIALVWLSIIFTATIKDTEAKIEKNRTDFNVEMLIAKDEIAVLNAKLFPNGKLFEDK